MFIDLDSGEDVSAAVTRVESIKESLRSGGGNKEVRIAIGCWVAKGHLNWATVQDVLLFTDSYQVVPAGKRDACVDLALWMTYYFYRNKPADLSPMSGVELFMYKAQQAMLILVHHFTLEEQQLIFDKLAKYKKFHG